MPQTKKKQSRTRSRRKLKTSRGVYRRRLQKSSSRKRPWITRKGKLGGTGYLSKPSTERHELLDKCVGKYGYRSCLGSIMVLNRNRKIKELHGSVIGADRQYLVRKYGGRGSFG